MSRNGHEVNDEPSKSVPPVPAITQAAAAKLFDDADNSTPQPTQQDLSKPAVPKPPQLRLVPKPPADKPATQLQHKVLGAVFNRKHDSGTTHTITAQQLIELIRNPVTAASKGITPIPYKHASEFSDSAAATAQQQADEHNNTRKTHTQHGTTAFKDKLRLITAFVGNANPAQLNHATPIYGKKQDDAKACNKFTHIRIDLDTGDFSLDQLIERANKHIPLNEYWIFNTSSSSANDRKWRIIVPLAHPVIGTHFEKLSLDIAAWFSSTPDKCTAAKQQGIYEPSIYGPKHEYQHHINSDQNPAVTLYRAPPFNAPAPIVPATPSKIGTAQEPTGQYWINEINQKPIDDLMTRLCDLELVTETRAGVFRNPAGESDNGLKLIEVDVEYGGESFTHYKLQNYGGSDFNVNGKALHNSQNWSRVDLVNALDGKSAAQQILEADPQGKIKALEKQQQQAMQAIDDAGLQAANVDPDINRTRLFNFDSLTDSGLALTLVEAYFKDNIRYIHDGTLNGNSWLKWNGNIWEPTDQKILLGVVDSLLSMISKQYRSVRSTDINSDSTLEAKDRTKLHQALNRKANALESTQQQRAVFAKVENYPNLRVSIDELDTHRHLLACPDGILNLKTKTLSAGERDQYITQSVPHAPITPDATDYNPWLDYLESSLVLKDGTPDTAVIDFLQVVAGYALTGETRDELFFYFYGEGGNGKSTFINALSHVMGNLSKGIKSEALLQSRNQKHSQSLARLNKCRLAISPDVATGQAWDNDAVKAVSSKDKITANQMGQNDQDFTTYMTTIAAGNSLPAIHNVENGVQRRFKLIDFGKTIPESERDNELTAELEAFAPQILDWMLDGALIYYREGIRIPESIQVASKAYVEGEDVVREFINECLQQDYGFDSASSYAQLNHVHTMFAEWSRERSANPNQRVLSRKAFKAKLANHGIEVKRSTVTGSRKQDDFLLGYTLIDHCLST